MYCYLPLCIVLLNGIVKCSARLIMLAYCAGIDVSAMMEVQRGQFGRSEEEGIITQPEIVSPLQRSVMLRV